MVISAFRRGLAKLQAAQPKMGTLPIGAGGAVSFAKSAVRITPKILSTAARVAAPIVSRITVKRAVIGTIGAGALTTSPKLRTALKKTPQTLYTAGQTLGTEIETRAEAQPSAKQQTAGGLIAGAALGIAGAVVVPKIIDKVKDREPTLKPVAPLMPDQAKEQIIGTSPILPETQEMPAKTPEKTAQEAPQAIFNNRVRVQVNPVFRITQSTKRYKSRISVKV